MTEQSPNDQRHTSSCVQPMHGLQISTGSQPFGHKSLLMKHLYSVLRLVALLIIGFAAPLAAQSPGPLNGAVFGEGRKALVVILHGDVSKGGPADYHYVIAKQIARKNPGVTVLAILRPGYKDAKGRASPGSNNNRRDHYTKRNNQLVAQTIQAMAKQVGTSNIIAVGHSGGAAQLGVIAGSHKGLLDSVILVSCPCDIPKWRAKKKWNPWPNSLSPHKYVGAIPRSTRLFVVVGSKDTNTYPWLSEEYVAAAKARGLGVAYVPVKGAGHGFRKMQSTVERLVKQEINN